MNSNQQENLYLLQGADFHNQIPVIIIFFVKFKFFKLISQASFQLESSHFPYGNFETFPNSSQTQDFSTLSNWAPHGNPTAAWDPRAPGALATPAAEAKEVGRSSSAALPPSAEVSLEPQDPKGKIR